MTRPVAQGNGLVCPKCGERASEVTDSRPGNGMHRRVRRCRGCECKYVTYELCVPWSLSQAFVRIVKVVMRSFRDGGAY